MRAATLTDPTTARPDPPADPDDARVRRADLARHGLRVVHLQEASEREPAAARPVLWRGATVGRPVRRAGGWAVGRSVGRVGRSGGRSGDLSVGRSAGPPAGRPVGLAIARSPGRSVGWSANQAIGGPVRRLVGRAVVAVR